MTEVPDRKEHFERLRWVSFAVTGMDCRAEEVIRVCATSRCVRCGNLGRRVENVEEGRMVHSCKLNRVIGKAEGRFDVIERAVAKASRKVAEEQAQKSNACNRGRSQRSVFMTSELRSSSICS